MVLRPPAGDSAPFRPPRPSRRPNRALKPPHQAHQAKGCRRPHQRLCDAGREGELIFNYIAQHAKAGKPVQRLWLQSMTQGAIRDGFARLRHGNEMRGLGDAAVCRSESDWLVGINGTRAMTAFNSKTGGFHLTTVGRVQTPTLAIVVERERKSANSRPAPTGRSRPICRQGRQLRRQMVRRRLQRQERGRTRRADRLWDEARAQAIRAATQGKPGEVTKKPPETRLRRCSSTFDQPAARSQRPLRLFRQDDALHRPGPLRKHKVLTHPRTDSRPCPRTTWARSRRPSTMLTGEGSGKGHDEVLLARYAPSPTKSCPQLGAAEQAHLQQRQSERSLRDHPHHPGPKHLNEVEQKLYDFVVKRFLSVFFPAAEYLVTTRITRVAGHPFKTEGKVLVAPGWLAIYGKEGQDGDEGNLGWWTRAKRCGPTKQWSRPMKPSRPALLEATLPPPWKAPAR